MELNKKNSTSSQRGREIKKTRPSLVMSNDVQNEFDEKIIVAPLTSDEVENIRFFEVFVKDNPENGLEKPSKVLCNRLQTIDVKVSLKGLVGRVSLEVMGQVDKALKVVLFLG